MDGDAIVDSEIETWNPARAPSAVPTLSQVTQELVSLWDLPPVAPLWAPILDDPILELAATVPVIYSILNRKPKISTKIAKLARTAKVATCKTEPCKNLIAPPNRTADQCKRWSTKTHSQPRRPLVAPGTFVPLVSAQAVQVGKKACVRLSALCSKCEPIRLWLKENWATWATSGSDSLRKDFNYYAIGAEAEESSRSGCHLCTLIFQSAWDPSKDIARYLTLEQSLIEVREAKEISLTVNLDLIDDCYCHSCTQGRVVHGDREVRILLTTSGHLASTHGLSSSP
jgi:hypothetical protein